MGAKNRQPATPAEAKALAHPLRLRILRLCLDETLSNRELAERLDKDPGTVLHHVRLLVDEGFLQEGEPRRGRRNSREKPYLATRKSWVLDFGPVDTSGDVAVATAEAFAAELRASGPASLMTYARLGVRLTPPDQEALVRRIDELAEEYSGLDDPNGEPVGIYLAAHLRGAPAAAEKEPA
jgi:DNA-binding transcriptional ArsR family regulator